MGGVDVDRLDDAQSARSIGYVFQNPDNQIVCESVWHEMAFCLENLGTPQDEMRRLIAETSYFFGIDDWFRQSTDSLSAVANSWLALASTLVAQPSLLLLDEPTSQLDPVAERNFLHALFRINRELGCTVVVATHAPRAMVDYATCAFELVDGQVRDISDMEALRMREPLVDADKTVPSRVQGEDAPCALTFDDAWFRYDRESPWVLRNLDLHVAKAQIHALVGGNGCGKSTLLALAAGSSRLQRGKVRAEGERRVLLPQDPRALFAAETAFDELMEWSGQLGYGEEEVHRLLEKLALRHRGLCIRTIFRAVSNSCSPSASCCWQNRTCCCSMSLPRAWTRRRAQRLRMCFLTFELRARPCSWRRMTSILCSRWPTRYP